MTWFNYLAFDIISDLAYGKPFGMVEKGEDITEVAIPGSKTGKMKRIPAIQIFNDHGEFTGSMGVLPLWLRPLVKKILSYTKGNKAMANVAGIASPVFIPTTSSLFVVIQLCFQWVTRWTLLLVHQPPRIMRIASLSTTLKRSSRVSLR
ncbi:hypothetical protein BDQ17DRAFT_460308, partial [Cyathus striatus]